MMKIDPISLNLFLAVLEEGTILKAAEREHIAASAISKRIKELEIALGTELFVRSNKGAEPTIAAQTLSSLARGTLNQLDNIPERMRGYSSGMHGHVRIAANHSSITQFLPNQLKSFLANWPDVQVQVKAAVSSSVAKSIAENQADLGLLQKGNYGYTIELLPYREDQLVIIANASHPISKLASAKIADMVKYDFVGSHTDSAIKTLLMLEASRSNLILNIKMQVSGFDALCVMVAYGLGIGILPKQCAELFISSLDLVTIPIDEIWARRQICIGVRDLDSLTPAAQLLVTHLLEN
jgi:DNA-binding transcriptional LysR family regulator